jgi:DNA-binding CsgD family transcriptional regulator
VSLAGKAVLARGRSSIDALERVGCAALVVGASGEVALMNARAERLLGGELQLKAGRLRALDRANDHKLQRLIDGAVAARGSAAAAPPPIFLARRDMRPYMIEAFPAIGAMRDLFGRVAALLVVTDLASQPKPAAELAREAFGLTATEARLATTLASGESLRAAAEGRGMTHETARGHLKSIFSKVGVHRQTELVAVLANLTLRQTQAQNS